MTNQGPKYSPLTQSDPDPQDQYHDDEGDTAKNDQELYPWNADDLERSGKGHLLNPGCETSVRRASSTRKACLLLSVLTVIVGGALAAVLLPLVNNSGGKLPVRHHVTNWRVVLNNTGTESCVRTPDIDGDGLPDVLIGGSHGVDLLVANTLTGDTSIKRFCASIHKEYPCVGFLLALRGYDGKELWRLPTRSEVLLLNCEEFDVNKDGVLDCVVAGRQSSVQAVDIRNGKTLWYSDGEEYPSYFRQTWNVYQPIALPDVDGDGVKDVLIAHGGDPNIDSKVHNRTAGRLIVLSGATGRPLGKYLELPDHKETYMTPVMYTASDSSQYVLFGSGGETVPGDLLAISVPNLLKAVGVKASSSVGHSGFAWDNLQGLIRHDNGILQLYRGLEKGVMVPPVLLDMNRDGQLDILVSVYDGTLVLLDGKTLRTIWTASFTGMESYSTPAPGYFDDDEYMDFVIYWNTGTWPIYNSTQTVVVSGKDGKVIWRAESNLHQMSSALVLRSNEVRHDHFLIKINGRSAVSGATDVVHGVGVQRVIHRRHTGDVTGDATEDMTGDVRGDATGDATGDVTGDATGDMTDDSDSEDDSCIAIRKHYDLNHVPCESDLSDVKEEVYLLDRKSASKPHKLVEYGARKYDYTYKPKPLEKSCIPARDDTGILDMCSVLMPDSRSTDAVTDVDGDGRLDLIHLGQLEGRLTDSRYSYTHMKFITSVEKMDIQNAVEKHVGSQNEVDDLEKDMNFASLQKQPWLQYLGTLGLSVFTDS